MLVSQIDYNLIGDIVRAKEAVKESVDGVMEGALTAAHLASEVYALLDHLDKLEVVWRGTPPTEETPPTAEAQLQQPAQETSPPEQPQPEQPVKEAAAEQPQPEQPPSESQQ